MSALLAAALLALSIPASAAAGPADGRNLELKVKASYRGLSDEAVFVVGSGSQSNFVNGGEKAVRVEGRTEYKKWGFIVNALPVLDPESGTVSLQLQIEISGPIETADGLDLATWQLQTQATVELGRKTVVASEPCRVTVTVSEAK